MAEPEATPRLFSLDYRPANDVSSLVAHFSAFSGIRRAPRSAEKAAWLATQGLNPEAAFPNQAAGTAQEE